MKQKWPKLSVLMAGSVFHGRLPVDALVGLAEGLQSTLACLAQSSDVKSGGRRENGAASFQLDLVDFVPGGELDFVSG